MEPLFENKYVKDSVMYKEYYSYYFFKRPILIVCDVILAVFLIQSLIHFIIYGLSTLNLYIVIGAVFAVSFQFINYYRFNSLAVKRDKEMSGGKTIENHFTVTDDSIKLIASNGAMGELDYSSIKNVICTKNFIVVQSKARLGYIFKKDGFIKGNAESFIKFLTSKGIKVK